MKPNKKDKKIINEMIRVNQAGEFGAKRIYEGQLAILPKDKTINPCSAGPCIIMKALHNYEGNIFAGGVVYCLRVGVRKSIVNAKE